MVEQAAVNRWVIGSSPIGAVQNKIQAPRVDKTITYGRMR